MVYTLPVNEREIDEKGVLQNVLKVTTLRSL